MSDSSNSKGDDSKSRKSRSERAKNINYPDPDKWPVYMSGDRADFSEKPSGDVQRLSEDSNQDSDNDSE
jgi:hypothetical protein